MPVPDSYSRRYGREETSYTSSYSRGATRSSYLSSYTSKQSTSLPPRPPLYSSDTYRKYGDPSSVTSRYLSSSTSSSRIGDYGTTSRSGGGGYRSSVSPVRATTTSAIRSSIADRIKAMDIDGKDDDSPLRTYTSRYSSLRNREPVTSSLASRTYTSIYSRDRSNSREYGVSPLIGSSNLSSTSVRERDPSTTRSSTENLKKRGSPSPSSGSGSRKDSGVVVNGLSSSEVIKPSSTSSSTSTTSESATCASKGVATVVDATSTTTTTKIPVVTTTTSSTSTVVAEHTTTDISVTTIIPPTVDSGSTPVVDNDGNVEPGVTPPPTNHVVTVSAADSSRASTKRARDLENNDVDSTSSSKGCLRSDVLTVTNNHATSSAEDEAAPNKSNSNPSLTKSGLGMVMMNNGNSSEDDGGKQDSRSNNGVVVMVVQDRSNGCSQKVKSVPSSSSALKDSSLNGGAGSSPVVVDHHPSGGEGALGSSASDSLFSPSVMEKDSNGNPILDTKGIVLRDPSQEVMSGKGRFGKGDEGGVATPSLSSRPTTSTTVKVTASSGVTRRRRESDSNANNLVETTPNGKCDESPMTNGDDSNKVSIQVNREPSPYESFTISKPRRSSTASAGVTVTQNGSASSGPSSSSPRSSSSRVIYHTIKVEDNSASANKAPSPEPVSFTVKAPPPPAAPTATFVVSDNKAVDPPKPSATKTSAPETSAEFKVSLPRRRSSTVKPTDLPSTSSSSPSTTTATPSTTSASTSVETRHSNGNMEACNGLEDSSNKCKTSSYTRQTSSPSKSGGMSNNIRTHRKSGSPAAVEKAGATNSHRSRPKNEEDSSSSVEDEHSERETVKPLKAPTPRSSITPTRTVGTSTALANRKSKSKSPSPRVSAGTGVTTANHSGETAHSSSIGNHNSSSVGASKYSSSEPVDNVNGYEMGGPHTSKFAYVPSQLTENSSALATNRNDRKSRYAHLTGASSAIASDSSDNDSDAFSSSPQLGGRFRAREGHERAGLTGLRNIGNTCFMNTVLQCLSNTKPLLEYVIRDNYTQDINTSTSAMKGSLIRAFSEVIQELWREQRVVDTSAFKDQIQKFAPRFMGYSQQDAQEFLRYLLEGLHEDVNRVTSKPTPILTDIDDSLSDSQKAAEAWKRYLRYEDSRIVDIFVGQLRSTLKCTVCGNCSVTFDPFWDLSLPIPARTASTRLAQCFELFNKEEVLDGDEKPTCSKCQCRRKCTKSFSIQKFPRILVIHLKRFSPTERYRGKLSTLVDCPITNLDLSPYAANRGQTLTYNLYGVANHSGSTYSGHYIAYCKHPYTGEWHSYNDSRVSPIPTHQVVSTEGYVLFYEQSAQSS